MQTQNLNSDFRLKVSISANNLQRAWSNVSPTASQVGLI